MNFLPGPVFLLPGVALPLVDDMLRTLNRCPNRFCAFSASSRVLYLRGDFALGAALIVGLFITRVFPLTSMSTVTFRRRLGCGLRRRPTAVFCLDFGGIISSAWMVANQPYAWSHRRRFACVPCHSRACGRCGRPSGGSCEPTARICRPSVFQPHTLQRAMLVPKLAVQSIESLPAFPRFTLFSPDQPWKPFAPIMAPKGN